MVRTLLVSVTRMVIRRLKAALGDEGAKKWPTISEQSSAYDKDSTEQISGEMTGLKTEEKAP